MDHRKAEGRRQQCADAHRRHAVPRYPGPSSLTQPYDHAVGWMSGAMTQDVRPEFLFSLGTALKHQGRFDEALLVFQHGSGSTPILGMLQTNAAPARPGGSTAADALGYLQPALKGDRTTLRRW